MRYDLRGHGRSGYPMNAASYESRRYAEDFKAVLEQTAGKEAVANLEGRQTEEERMDVQ